MEKRENAKFAFTFSPSMIAAFTVLLALCAAGVALTTWQLVGFLQGDISSVWKWMQFLLMYLVCALLTVLVVAMLIKSQYIITDKELICCFGLIRSKYELSKIYSVRHFKGSGKLAVYFDDYKNKYTIIVVKESWYDAFVKELQARNDKIEYDFMTAEEESDLKKK